MQVKFFVIVVEIDLEDCGTLISDETAHSITTIEDTKTGPLSLTVTTDRVQTVSVTTIEDTKTGPLSLTVTTDRVQTVSVTTIEDTKNRTIVSYCYY